MKDQILEQSQNLSWAGATIGVVGGITLTEALAIGGFVLALFGAVVLENITRDRGAYAKC